MFAIRNFEASLDKSVVVFTKHKGIPCASILLIFIQQMTLITGSTNFINFLQFNQIISIQSLLS